jgi:hypothetical protein
MLALWLGHQLGLSSGLPSSVVGASVGALVGAFVGTFVGASIVGASVGALVGARLLLMHLRWKPRQKPRLMLLPRRQLMHLRQMLLQMHLQWMLLQRCLQMHLWRMLLQRRRQMLLPRCSYKSTNRCTKKPLRLSSSGAKKSALHRCQTSETVRGALQPTPTAQCIWRVANHCHAKHGLTVSVGLRADRFHRQTSWVSEKMQQQTGVLLA